MTTSEQSATKQRSAARLAIPRAPRTWIPRPRLLRSLHAAVGGGLTVVQAPAGYGKTATLAAFARDIAEHYAVRWLTLDASAGAPEVLAGQLAATLAGEPPAAGAAPATRDDDLRFYLTSVLQRACAASDLPLMLVIDNAHELQPAPRAADLLSWLIDTLPEGLEVVLSGRAPANVYAADERVTAGQAAFIDASDLAFTADEIGAAVAAHGIAAGAGGVITATRGWPVAVMGVLSGAIALEPGKRARGSGAWERYLLKAVWSSVPADVQGGVMALALPPIFDRRMGPGITGSAHWEACWRWLSERDFLLESLPDGRYRLNPLVRTFLVDEFRRRAPAAFQAQAERIAKQMDRTGHIADALEMARQCGLGLTAADLMERNRGTLIHQGAFGLLHRGFEVVSPEVLEGRPLLRGVRAQAFAHLGRPHEALADAEAVLSDQQAPPTARVHALLARIRAYRLLGQTGELRKMFAEVRSVPTCDEPALLTELTYQEAVFELSINRDLDRAERLLQQTLAQAESAGVRPLGLLANSTLGQLLTIRGDGPRAVTQLTRAAQGWRDWGATANLGWVLNNLGMAYIMVADFESAVGALHEAQREATVGGNARALAYATASLGDAQLALGDYPAARANYEEAIRMCAEEIEDESLAALCMAGVSAAVLRTGDLTDADFFSDRATIVAEVLGNPYELGLCRLQHATVQSHADDHSRAIGSGREAVTLLEVADSQSNLRLAWYRLALFYFRANRRAEAQQALQKLGALITEPWMLSVLVPEVREYPLFAQWAASKGLPCAAFREMVDQHPFHELPAAAPAPAHSVLPRVEVHSLGQVRVSVGDAEVPNEAWKTARAKEMFFLFLANRAGLRKEEAVEQLFGDVPAEKINSAFHSNLYRVRRALYQASIERRDGIYLLNERGEFEWDVERFEAAIEAASRLPRGSEERAREYQRALDLYDGPFAESFYGEWAETVRRRLSGEADEALSLLAGYYAGREEYESASVCVRQLLDRDPFNEEAAYRLATYQLRGGQPIVALRIIDDFRRRYEDEVGEAVPARFGTLRARIAAGAI